ncbi:DUF1343 domain-containing protein [Flavobacteriaceae bacterium TP-CH-4]|uniref:DUF1343 domain-containing protein n=1 Tax=Pelagihabitans pacificus TaxID=2696054 RepID=A0A967ASJ9_9FLAO|nr:DUF1343 domain-containing protein [Pelagihabitans pacificus]NHF58153.1 DUF1343 domain-containing protein [Pelagihabitans pacificus]
MAFISAVKSTFLLWVLWVSACGNPSKQKNTVTEQAPEKINADSIQEIVVAANRTTQYIPLLREKKVGVVANQTSVIFKGEAEEPRPHIHLIDSLLVLGVNIGKVFAPEHGFRGKADAGEKVSDGTDTKTGLPIISLYGTNRKPTKEQLKDLDLVLFDIQDVGVRFYTYIATLQLVMEACAENGIPIVVLDRPNPNAHYVDGPTMEKAHTGFLGMTEIPLVYGMTIGEYATMINGEGWLEGGNKADLTVVTLENWDHNSDYSLPIRPSPNLPDDVSINLYPSLGLFEGTNINAGRGTEFQFQRYGAPFLTPEKYDFNYIPTPNFGSKNPKHQGETCYGKDLSQHPKMNKVSLEWVIDAYRNAKDPGKMFNTEGFTKHAGTEKLQKQIEAGLSEEAIKATWQNDLNRFKKLREKYLLYD